MKKITSLVVALIFTIAIGLAVINTAKSVQNSGNVQYYANIGSPPPPSGDKKK